MPSSESCSVTKRSPGLSTPACRPPIALRTPASEVPGDPAGGSRQRRRPSRPSRRGGRNRRPEARAPFAASGSSSSSMSARSTRPPTPSSTSAITGANGGFLVISAPITCGHHSSQNEQYSRFYVQSAQIPCDQPSHHQEAYDMAREAGQPTVSLMLSDCPSRMCLSAACVLFHSRCGEGGNRPGPRGSPGQEGAGQRMDPSAMAGASSLLYFTGQRRTILGVLLKESLFHVCGQTNSKTALWVLLPWHRL